MRVPGRRAATCVDCGCLFGSRPAVRRCPDCWAARRARVEEVRAAAEYRSVARKKSRGGTPGYFRIRSTFLGCHISWGSCETREEAFLEAGWILAAFPATSGVAVEEVVRYEISRDGLESCSGDSAVPGSAAASALAAVLEARLGSRLKVPPVTVSGSPRLAMEAVA